MSAPIVRAQYEQLEQIAARFAAAAEQQQALQERVNRQVEVLRSGSWQGKGVAAFLREMDGEVKPAEKRLIESLRQAGAATQMMSSTMNEAERLAAQLFMKKEASSESPSIWESVVKAGSSFFGFADDLFDAKALVTAPLLMFWLKQGSSYSGQLVLRSPDWFKSLGIGSRWLKGMAGVSENLTHIKVANLADHIGKMGKRIGFIGGLIAAGQGTFAVLSEWNRRGDEYAGYATSRHISAATVDAVLAATPTAGEVIGGIGGTVAGAKLGLIIGGAAGSFVPVIGNVVGAGAGALIGGAIGGLAGDWLGGQIGTQAADLARNTGGRESAIKLIDKNIVNPVVSSVTTSWQQIDQWTTDFDLSRVNFGLK